MTSISAVTSSKHSDARRGPLTLQVLLAFFAIYFLWGSTYFSIRVVVATVPPLLAAGVRFVLAGSALYLWARLRGVPAPSRLEWRNLSLLGALLFLAAYSGLFWAEKTIPSGVAALLVATIPIWAALFEIFVFKRASLHLTLVLSICLGLAGVAVLTLDSSASRLQLLPCLAILGSEICWSFGTVLSKELALPRSKVLSSGAQMMTGGVMLLLISAAAGNLYPLPKFSLHAAGALLYLIVAGSLIAFTAYVWLLGRMPVSTVASYAYVNPLVALVIGHWLGREAIGWRTLCGAVFVLASVAILLLKQPPKSH